MILYRFACIFECPHTQVFQGNNPNWIFILREEINMKGAVNLSSTKVQTICLNFPYFLQHTYCCVLKVVQAAVCQNKPSSLPGFNPTTFNKQSINLQEKVGDTICCYQLSDFSVWFKQHHLTHFKEPALSVWIKKCQREVVSIIHGDFEWLAADACIQFLEV